MTNQELKILRKVLFLSVKEAATYIAGHSTARTWQYYESGERNIPDDVVESINNAINNRQKKIEILDDIIDDYQTDQINIDFYKTHKEYRLDHKGATFVDWRISQSVAAYFLAEGLAKLNLT